MLAESETGPAYAGNARTTADARYVAEIWRSRYFWAHLALSDLRSRWRRSFVGALWSVLQPLGMTLLLALVFSRIFHTELGRYAPYIFSGMITWDFVASTVVNGALAFVQADAYIRQARRPLAIYTLRTALTNLIVFAFASIGLFLWALFALPQNFGLCWIAAAAVYPLLLVSGWAVASSLAYVTVRFRDIPHALGLVLQAAWFVSPVYFEPKLFRDAGLGALVDQNPIYHVLQIVRAPLLEGQWPTLENFAYAAALAAVFGAIAWMTGRRMERNVIFYL